MIRSLLSWRTTVALPGVLLAAAALRAQSPTPGAGPQVDPRLQSVLDSATAKVFWPAFPRDFVVIEVTPDWLEFIGPGVWNDPNTWRPQGVVFE